MNARAILPTVLLALVLTACGGQAVAPAGPAMPDVAAPSAAEGQSGEVTAGGAPALDSKASPYNTAEQPQAPPDQFYDRLVIKNADLSLQVVSVRDAESAIRNKVAALGGYVVQAESSGSDDDLTVRISFRVPATRFDDALAGVEGVAKKVLSRTLSGDDVTEEFVDLQSRLSNLEATRDRLLSFLDKATRVEDALAVNQSLTDVQGQIEQIKGRMQYLKQSAALSTISVALLPVPVTPIIEEEGWQPLAVARAALRDLIQLGQGLANLGIVLLVWTPVWLPLALGGLWIYRRVRSRVARPRAATTSTTT